MEQTVSPNNRGFTLVEVLIALVVILIGLLGLLQVALLSIEHNFRNLLRDEAVNIADQMMDGVVIDKSGNKYQGLRNRSFDSVASIPCFPVTRNFRNAQRDFTVCTQVESIIADAKGVQIYVGWNFKNQLAPTDPTTTGNFAEYWHIVATVLRRSS